MSATIVVVDSEPVVRDIIKKILEREGYRVMPTEDVTAAMEIIKIAHPSLVITNVNLPGMTGHDAMRMFKQGCPGVPVLMISGLPDSDVIQQWISEEGFDTFPKPFSAHELATKVKQVITEARPS